MSQLPPIPGQQPQQHGQPQYGQPQQQPQYGQPAPGYGQPSPFGGQPTSYGPPAPYAVGPTDQVAPAFVDLTVQGSSMTSSLVPPRVRVNGFPLQDGYGLRRVSVPPGPVRVDVTMQWMREYGQASLVFTAEPGQVVPVFYAGPWHQFTTGSIGHQKQSRKGVGFLVGLVALPVAIMLVAAVAIVSTMA
ncbi:hypothetical protein [Miniimonas sp. S16]|uniref:hypothetical protein n=1 Tax=Miniimonas sp. S16 TaxID=2171623 RepID=UPI000D528B97|nr:hypothetical protein [Miniimonas sp. S16]